jgi:hypothetical protein
MDRPGIRHKWSEVRAKVKKGHRVYHYDWPNGKVVDWNDSTGFGITQNGLSVQWREPIGDDSYVWIIED